jgi:hypothetical protein
MKPPLRCAVEPPHQKSVVRACEFARQAFRHGQPAPPREGLYHQLPGTHVVLIAHAGELGNPQLPLRIGNTGFGTRAPERATGCNQHAQPVVARGRGVVFVPFQRQAGRFQFPQLYERRRSRTTLVVEKITFIVEAQTQGTGAVGIVHAQQVVRFVQAHGLGDLPGPLRALQPAAHEQAAPAIRARIGEYAEVLVTLRRMLPPFKEAKPGIQVKISGGGVRKRGGVKLELEDFPARPTPGMQQSQAQRFREPDPVRVDGDGRRHTLNAPSSAVPRDQSGRPALQNWRSHLC